MSFRKFLVLAILILSGSLLVLNGTAGGQTGTYAEVLAVGLGAALMLVVAGWAYRRSFLRGMERLRRFTEELPEKSAADSRPLGVGGDLESLAKTMALVAPRVRALVERLRIEASHREAILSGMVEGVLAVDQEFKITFCNQAFARSIGASGPIARGIPLLKLVRDPEMLDLLRAVMREQEPAARRVQLAAAEGHWFEVQVGPLDVPSGSGALAVLHDITQQEHLERVRRDFVANVSHELRTPLAAIRGYAETLLAGALEEPENRRRFVEIIEAHAIRLNNIASDLLVLSELESNAMRPEPERCSIREILQAALRTVESEARLRAVQLVCVSIGDMQVMGYRLRLEQAFVNLLNNAIKFNRPGGEVRLSAELTAAGQARITVSDTGIGIPSADLPRIFERFYRVDKARSREVGGTGLGLSIVRHVIEQMHGVVSVESQLGKGSTFTVQVPVV